MTEDRDFYQEYLEWYNSSWHSEDSRPLTREEFYRNFPDTKPRRRK